MRPGLRISWSPPHHEEGLLHGDERVSRTSMSPMASARFVSATNRNLSAGRPGRALRNGGGSRNGICRGGDMTCHRHKTAQRERVPTGGGINGCL